MDFRNDSRLSANKEGPSRARLTVGGIAALLAMVCGLGALAAGILTRQQQAAVTPPPAPRPAVTFVATAAIANPAATLPQDPAPGATAPTSVVSASAPPAPVDTNISPIFGPKYNAADGLPTYLCASIANGSYFIPQLIQTAGLDVANGFHLGIVPLDLNEQFSIPEPRAGALVREGKLDCLITTLDSVALNAPGMITLIVDESAGTDTLWARNLATVNELQGKRLAVEMGGSSEYFALYMLNTLQLKPGVDAQLQTYDFLDDAIQAFNSGQADAVSGWEPTIFAAKEGGGKPLVSTRDFRAIVDVVVTSPRDITERTAVVQSFHNAWFDALNLQSSDFPRAAALLAGWGNNEWTGISVANAESDWREQLTTIAQASLAQNTLVMRQPESLAARLDEARLIWTNAGKQLAGGVATTRVEPQFVLRAAREFVAQGKPDRGTFPNMSFSLSGADVLAQAIPVIGEADAGAQATPTAAPVPAATAAPTAEPTAVPTVAITETPLAAAATREGASVIAVLPCKRFDFIPETTTLTPEASALLDQCVLRTLQRTVNVYIRVQGSAAWPGPPGTFKREDIQAFAQARSQAIVDYLTAKGVNRGRFIVEAVLPPESHWETEDLTLQAQDRYVEVSLVSGGR